MADSITSAQPVKIVKAKVGANMILTPKTALTHNNFKELEAVLDELIDQKRFRIIIDFKTVPFVDSMVLELLLKHNNDLKTRGGALKFIGLNPVCRDILLITRLINIFNVFDDLNEALKS